jgi:hypothetical protein
LGKIEYIQFLSLHGRILDVPRSMGFIFRLSFLSYSVLTWV